MSLAPASSRGAFLKARLAVNGIQCAARSFGTLTSGRTGLLSSIGASSHFWARQDLRGTLAASGGCGNGQLGAACMPNQAVSGTARPTNTVMAGLDPAIH